MVILMNVTKKKKNTVTLTHTYIVVTTIIKQKKKKIGVSDWCHSISYQYGNEVKATFTVVVILCVECPCVCILKILITKTTLQSWVDVKSLMY